MRPRLILVPNLTELEWPIRPLLEQWADVAYYDAPGVGDEPRPREYRHAAVVERGLAEIDRRGWDRYIVAGDEFGTIPAAMLAASRPGSVAGIALGHACLHFDREGDRAAVSGEVMGAFERLASIDYRTYVRHLTQVTQGAYDDELADRYLERVPQEVSLAYAGEEEPAIEPLVRSVDAPLLLAKHDGCLGWKDEAFEDAVAAFPDAMTFSTPKKPSVCEDFAKALKDFSERVF